MGPQQPQGREVGSIGIGNQIGRTARFSVLSYYAQSLLCDGLLCLTRRGPYMVSSDDAVDLEDVAVNRAASAGQVVR